MSRDQIIHRTKELAENAKVFVLALPKRFKHLSLPMMIAIISGGIIIAIIFVVTTYLFFVGDLATPEKLMNRNNTGLILMDRKGKAFYKTAEARDIDIYPIERIPDHMIKAIIAIEDDQFYEHPGFSPKGIARAFWANIRASGYAQGGSTITQQLVKNALLTPEKSIHRKLQEVLLALEVDRRYTKDEILEMYLNSIYFGAGAYGIEAAAATYFDKDVAELTVGESAILAALPKSPSGLSPFGGDLERLEARQTIILEKLGYDPKKVGKVKYKEQEEETPTLAPHFAIWVRDYLYEKYGEDEVNRQGFRVITTIDRDYQTTGETLIRQHIGNLNRRDATNASLVSLNPITGEIMALVGSVDWTDEEFGKFNVAFAKRQPGSTFKPIVYTQAFTDGAHPEDKVMDEAINIAGYQPQNYDGKFRGEVTLRRALANSLNIPAVKVLQTVGVKDAVKIAHDMGITSLDKDQNYGLSLVLGGGEVTLFEITRAFGVLATNGELVASHPILKIEDKYGKEIYRYTSQTRKEISEKEVKEPYEKQFIGGTYAKKVIDSAAAFLTTSILSDNEARKETLGETNWLNLGRPAGAKTGTTNDFRDAWTIGYTPTLVTGIWVGNNDNTPMNGLFGSVAAAPIWHGFMTAALKGTQPREFTRPTSLIEVKLCKETNKYCSLCKETYSQYYSKKHVPDENCSDITPTPTQTPTPPPTNTPAPTNTPLPTAIPTATTVPSATLVPPTATPNELPTNTPTPPSVTPTPTI
ncbi:MAG: PBP1A family penicillin-binding protein [bacterium]|nr:PBP1A family penicillin-binding protein [bacterium]